MPEQQTEIELESEQLKYLKQIDQKLYRLTSLKWNFLMGLMKGVSTMIGATIITAMVFAMIAQIISSMNGFPIIEQLIQNSGIEAVVKQQGR